MNCINCFHYNACASVDLTGYVTDVEHEDYICEHFITPEEVHPVARAVESISDYGHDDIFVNLLCPNCHELLAIKSYLRKDWDNYFKDKHSLKYSRNYCPKCGTMIAKEENNAS
jgi:predicted RNA-binding Zn-ribbon protein involved in translation (DUF1610 family)